MNKIISFFPQALQYNVPCGKKNRGLATVLAYKSLVGNESLLTPENVRLAHYLGWCVEMVSKIQQIEERKTKVSVFEYNFHIKLMDSMMQTHIYH